MNHIEQYRKQANLTQQQATEKAGWRYQSRWSGYERGVRTPDVHDAQIIVQALNACGVVCTVEDVFPIGLQIQPTQAQAARLLFEDSE